MLTEDSTSGDSRPALELLNAEKRYGKLEALRGLDMHVGEGDIYGFLGRNGAGKSTALRIIMGVTHADRGELRLFGQPVGRNDPVPRRQIGYVAQEQNFYGWMTAPGIGRFVAGFYPGWDDAEYRRLLDALEVPLDRKIHGFSGGMHAKLALALALASNPRLLLLDEPTAGMDAVARREFLDIVRDASRRSHRTTLFSSHLIDEVEMAADKVGILDQGVMRFEGSLATLKQSVRRYAARLSGDAAPPPDFDGADVLRDDVRDGQREIYVHSSNPAALPREASLPPGWQMEQPSLESVFVAMVGKSIRL
ncbi:MAG: ABC transporter ATP-binding protein [Pseudomonadota bacterium]